jgi:Fe-S-cluster containining protein
VPVTVVERPVWRRFVPRFEQEAAEHVRRGGLAAIEGDGGRVDVLMAVDDRGKLVELGLWALLAIEQRRWRRVREGAAAGLATTRIKEDFVDVVLDWCERDRVHPGATRSMALDCLACAACCRDMNVVLGSADIDRWAAAKRRDLFGRAYIRRKRDGRLTLKLHDTGRCLHLQRDSRCRIYELRPDNCRVFPVGSEACLAAREDTLGWRDG